jgi:hypothetical protein
MQSRLIRIIATSVAAGFLFFGASVMAQSNNPELDDVTIERFVDAYTDVKAIQTDYTRRMKAITDAGKTRELQEEAERKMQDAVTRNNISLEEYRKIAQRVTQDPELRSRVQSELEGR